MKGEKYYDFDRSILDVAEDFYGAYCRCREGKNPRIDKWGRHRSDVVNIPAIVNGSFAIELYLKSISPLSEDELRKKSHHLKKLFETLEVEDQSAICERVEKELQSFNCSFEEGLAVINNSFTFWRYIHTKPNLGYGLNKTLIVLSIFVESVRQYVIDNNGRKNNEE